MVLLIVVAVCVIILTYVTLCVRRKNPDSRAKQNDPDREPQRSDFRADYRTGELGASHRYHEAHKEWERRRARKITYEMPINEILALPDGERAYQSETATRNPKRQRGRFEGSGFNDAEHYCEICGNHRTNALHSDGQSLCTDCLRNYKLAKDPRNSCQLPEGLLAFSARLWVRQMAIELDLEEGVIDEIQASRERELVVAFELRHQEEQVTEAVRKQEQANQGEQERDKISALANRLQG